MTTPRDKGESPKRNPDPKSLAESLGAAGSPCPIPFTHDRLQEVHHWWHEVARYYHEPDPFRYGLGAFVQAARNVTWVLQSEKAVFREFSWYDEWRERAKKDALLRWLHDTRTGFVHRQALEPKSWLRMRCIDNPRGRHYFDEEDDEEGDGSLLFNVSPFACTHYYIRQGWPTDHAHEFTRHWEIEGLPHEVLDGCADIYDRLDELVTDAHRRLGGEVKSYKAGPSGRTLPCMEDTSKHRIIRTSVREGKEIWENEPSGLHVQ